MLRKHHRLPSYSPGVAGRHADPFLRVLRRYRPMPELRPYQSTPVSA
jgi:hypothetical protein